MELAINVGAIAVRKTKEVCIMRYLVMMSILVVATGSAMSQERPKYEMVPDHMVLVAIASQANCPLKIEYATFLKRVDQPGVLVKYRLRNISKKPIEFVSVMIQYSSGTGGNSMPMPRVKKVLLPNETLESSSEPIDYEIVGVYKANQKPSSSEELKTLCVLLVDKVLFTDGSAYEAPKTLDALSRFFRDGYHR